MEGTVMIRVEKPLWLDSSGRGVFLSPAGCGTKVHQRSRASLFIFLHVIGSSIYFFIGLSNFEHECAD